MMKIFPILSKAKWFVVGRVTVSSDFYTQRKVGIALIFQINNCTADLHTCVELAADLDFDGIGFAILLAL